MHNHVHVSVIHVNADSCDFPNYQVLKLRPSLTVLDGKKRESPGPLDKRKQSGQKTVSQPLLGKQKKLKQNRKQEEEEEDVKEEEEEEEERVCAENVMSPHRGEVWEGNRTSRTRKRKTKMTASLVVAERDQPVAEAASRTKRKEQKVLEESTEIKDKRSPVGRTEESSAPLGKRKGNYGVEEAHKPRKKKQKTVHESDAKHNTSSTGSSVAAKDSPPGSLDDPASGAGLLKAEQQSLKRGLKGSLKNMTKGRSGVVAVKDIRRKRKGRSGGWDPAGVSSGTNVFQVGSGQASTWT